MTAHVHACETSPYKVNAYIFMGSNSVSFIFASLLNGDQFLKKKNLLLLEEQILSFKSRPPGANSFL